MKLLLICCVTTIAYVAHAQEYDRTPKMKTWADNINDALLRMQALIRAAQWVCRANSSGIYIPLLAIPQDGEPWYYTVQECQAACDVWNRQNIRDHEA